MLRRLFDLCPWRQDLRNPLSWTTNDASWRGRCTFRPADGSVEDVHGGEQGRAACSRGVMVPMRPFFIGRPGQVALGAVEGLDLARLMRAQSIEPKVQSSWLKV
jgi:hypothetical protein